MRWKRWCWRRRDDRGGPLEQQAVGTERAGVTPGGILFHGDLLMAMRAVDGHGIELGVTSTFGLVERIGIVRDIWERAVAAAPLLSSSDAGDIGREFTAVGHHTSH